MDAKVMIVAAIAVIAAGGAGFFSFGGIGGHDITYDLDGGTNADSNPTNYSGVPIALQDPLKKGYSFGGWYADEELTEEMSVVSPDDGKIKVYAKWVLEEYTIDYQLNGGMMSSDNPSTYTVEDKVVLNSPKKIMMTFSGWYADESLSPETKVTDLSTMSGDLTLYAGYDTVVGKRYDYSISGTLAGANVSGSLSVSYSAYTDGQYLLVEEETILVRTARGEEISIPYYSSSFEENGFVRDGAFERTETDDRLGQSLDVYKSTDGGITGYDYLLNGSTVVRSTVTGTHNGEGANLTYELENISTFVPKGEYTVTIFYGNGLSSVSGAGTYGAGEKVTLSAVTNSGVAFKGWCDGNGNVYDGSKTFEIDAAGSDVTLYALCERDVFLSTPVSAPYPDAIWVVEEKYTREHVATVYGNPAICNLPTSGEYLCMFTGTDADGRIREYALESSAGGSVETTYQWTYDGRSYGMEWTTPQSNYLRYKELNPIRYHTTDERDANFVTFTSLSVSILSDLLVEESQGMGGLQRANFILQFVEDTVDYQLDTEGSGDEEYWKYPIETLFEKTGDCEDTAILYAALMKAAGYDVVLLRFTDHMAVGLAIEGAYGCYFDFNEKKYYYCETTGDTDDNWNIGEVPPEYDGESAYTTAI